MGASSSIGRQQIYQGRLVFPCGRSLPLLQHFQPAAADAIPTGASAKLQRKCLSTTAFEDDDEDEDEAPHESGAH